MEIIKRIIKPFIFSAVLFVGIIWFAQPVSAIWVYEQKFNTLTDGDLNGQDSWVAGTPFDVQTTTIYEGAKAVQITTTAVVEYEGTRVVTGITNGDLYVAMRKDSTSIGQMYSILHEGAAGKMYIRMTTDGNISIFDYNILGYQTILAYNANQWYVVNIQFDDVAQPEKYRARAHDGTSWTAWSSWYTVQDGAYTQIDKIRFNWDGTTTASQSGFWDTITPTDPTLPAATPPQLIWFE